MVQGGLVDAPDASAALRPDIERATDWVSFQMHPLGSRGNTPLPIGVRWGAQSAAVPVPIVEAVISRESGGDPDIGCNQWGACGPMQIVPEGQESQWWGEWTDDYPTDTELANDLDFNLRVGTFGLGERFQQVCRIGEPACNWFAAATAYFGCMPDAEGRPNPNCDDPLGTSGPSYSAYLREYISEAYGEDVVQKLDKGEWQEWNPNDGLIKSGWRAIKGALDCVANPLDCAGTIGDCLGDPLECAKRGAREAILEQVNAFINLLKVNLPRIGIAIIGTVVLGLGLVGIIRG